MLVNDCESVTAPGNQLDATEEEEREGGRGKACWYGVREGGARSSAAEARPALSVPVIRGKESSLSLRWTARARLALGSGQDHPVRHGLFGEPREDVSRNLVTI